MEGTLKAKDNIHFMHGGRDYKLQFPDTRKRGRSYFLRSIR